MINKYTNGKNDNRARQVCKNCRNQLGYLSGYLEMGPERLEHVLCYNIWKSRQLSFYASRLHSRTSSLRFGIHSSDCLSWNDDKQCVREREEDRKRRQINSKPCILGE